jgi:hypothetical protein
MYSHHHSGMLELELADWKHNRMWDTFTWLGVIFNINFFLFNYK